MPFTSPHHQRVDKKYKNYSLESKSLVVLMHTLDRVCGLQVFVADIFVCNFYGSKNVSYLSNKLDVSISLFSLITKDAGKVNPGITLPSVDHELLLC